MGNLIEYECPYCGGRVEFDSVTQKMKCPFCDSSFEIDELDYLEEEEDLKNAEAGVEETPSAVEKPEESMEWNIEAGNAWSSAEQEGVKVYVCKSCGGEIVGDATMASTKCPYCDNPIVMSGNLAGDLKPDYVIPFIFVYSPIFFYTFTCTKQFVRKGWNEYEAGVHTKYVYTKIEYSRFNELDWENYHKKLMQEAIDYIEKTLLEYVEV